MLLVILSMRSDVASTKKARPGSTTRVFHQESEANIFQEYDYAIRPRRKAGQLHQSGNRAPVRLTKTILSNFFGMPLSAAANELVHFIECYKL